MKIVKDSAAGEISPEVLVVGDGLPNELGGGVLKVNGKGCHPILELGRVYRTDILR